MTIQSQQLVEMARACGLAAVVDEDGVFCEDELLLGFSGLPLLVELRTEETSATDEVVVLVSREVVDCDAERVETVERPPLIAGFWIEYPDSEVVAREGDDSEVFVVAATTFAFEEGQKGLDRCRGAVQAFLTDLAQRGILSFVAVGQVDPSIVEDAKRLLPVKRDNPNRAAELALDLAQRCRELADFTAASCFDLAAADVLCDLGKVRAAIELCDPAWLVLGEPVENGDLVATYSKVLACAGRAQEAVQILIRSGDSDDPATAALARGNRGVVSIASGHIPEGIVLLQESLADPALPEEYRRALDAALAQARRSVGSDVGLPPRVSRDVLDQIDDDIDELSSLLTLSANPIDVRRMLPGIEDKVARLRQAWDRLGPSQQARILIVEGIISFLRARPHVSGERFRQAIRIAEQAGSPEHVRYAVNLMSSLEVDPRGASAPVGDLSPLERVSFYFNRAYFTLAAAVTIGVDEQFALSRALLAVTEAVRAVDQQRHQYRSVTDREAAARYG
ncbi:MAG: hypothetical protein ACRDQZ_18975, partial [Mycobacteriales bacterium]